MTVAAQSFETGHKDAIHDAKLDFYGRRLATASSDHAIRLWDVSTAEQGSTFLSELNEHDGPVWGVAWGPPATGLLASCGYDGKIAIWKETHNKWDCVHQEQMDSPVNCVAFIPGSGRLVAGGSDGSVFALSLQNGRWNCLVKKSSSSSINSVACIDADSFVVARDNHKLDLWSAAEGDLAPVAGAFPTIHKAPVLSVAHRHSGHGDPGLLVSGCRQGLLCFWKQSGSTWTNVQSLQLDNPIWELSWSVTGVILAVAHGEEQCLVRKSRALDSWEVMESGVPSE